MTGRHPTGLPELFLDRSLGRRQVPALLRAAGLHLRTLSEEYGIPADELVADTEWLERPVVTPILSRQANWKIREVDVW